MDTIQITDDIPNEILDAVFEYSGGTLTVVIVEGADDRRLLRKWFPVGDYSVVFHTPTDLHWKGDGGKEVVAFVTALSSLVHNRFFGLVDRDMLFENDRAVFLETDDNEFRLKSPFGTSNVRALLLAEIECYLIRLPALAQLIQDSHGARTTARKRSLSSHQVVQDLPAVLRSISEAIACFTSFNLALREVRVSAEVSEHEQEQWNPYKCSWKCEDRATDTRDGMEQALLRDLPTKGIHAEQLLELTGKQRDIEQQLLTFLKAEESPDEPRCLGLLRVIDGKALLYRLFGQYGMSDAKDRENLETYLLVPRFGGLPAEIVQHIEHFKRLSGNSGLM